MKQEKRVELGSMDSAALAQYCVLLKYGELALTYLYSSLDTITLLHKLFSCVHLHANFKIKKIWSHHDSTHWQTIS